ncbi:MAG: DUF2304 domain-containing protein [Candidatus Omnitrophica bacterium]|nr:DUF2304 domain-containing protein [Candidatus Omnitrophota bacterium]
MTAKFLAILLSCALLGVVIDLVRREKLLFHYAAGWLAVGLAALFFAIFDGLLGRVAVFCGFILVSNFVFFALLGALVSLSLGMTIFLCRQNKRNNQMAQKIAILEYELQQLSQQRTVQSGQETSK